MIPLRTHHSSVPPARDLRPLTGGVIGFGPVARRIVHQLRENFPGVTITAVCDPDEERLADAAGTFAIPGRFRTAESLCAEPLDFVMVLSCNRAHARNVIAAADRGLPIFCEKPIAIHLPDADAMVAAVDRAGVATLVNYSLRFNPAYEKVHALCQAGEVGDILAVQCSRFRGFGLHAHGVRHPAVENPESSGGWVIHHACHAIDAVYRLAGEFDRVAARTHTTHPRTDAAELVWGLGALKSGATAVVGDSVCALKQEFLVVQGTRGHIILDIHDRNQAQIRLYREGEGPPSPETFALDGGKNPVGALARFFDCVRTGAPSACTIREARHSLAVACAMEASARSGTFVRVPGPGEPLDETGVDPCGP